MSIPMTTLAAEHVAPEERIVRFILCPKNWDAEEKKMKPNFIHLRTNEPGVSFVRYDFLGGQEATIEKGNEYAEAVNRNKRKKGKPFAEEHLIGWGTCKAQEIINLDPKVISLIVDRPKETPYHVAIQFCLEGGVVRGIVKDAYILELFETIEDSILKYELLSDEGKEGSRALEASRKV